MEDVVEVGWGRVVVEAKGWETKGTGWETRGSPAEEGMLGRSSTQLWVELQCTSKNTIKWEK